MPHPPWLARRNLVRFELGFMSFFHAVIALIVLFAPRKMVVTPGTAAIFGTIPPIVWVVMFSLTSFAAGMAAIRQTTLAYWLTWAQVFPMGLGWVLGFYKALSHGHGSAIFPVVWGAVLVWWALTAIRAHNGEQGTRWNGGP